VGLLRIAVRRGSGGGVATGRGGRGGRGSGAAGGGSEVGGGDVVVCVTTSGVRFIAGEAGEVGQWRWYYSWQRCVAASGGGIITGRGGVAAGGEVGL
jgi:hypothetical protein